MIKYLYVVNNRGELRLVRYYKHYSAEERQQLQTDVIKLCLTRGQDQSTILDYEDYTVVFQKFSNTVFIAGITQDENELAILGLFRHICETLNKYLGSLTELHFIFNLDKVHMVLDEMILNGYIAETSQARILAPLQLLTSAKK
ncbi:AP-4 complex subunit sigma-1-like isoform X3 [Mercenaria mercenaria]|uniref:AP-4 complex subunit sigma-1-like isoform X3 n=1 Tax=Mercenaria mercenaria TaxID=6596 RepID=UPI001E1D4452|nr:AP-4 complex subunit sigma-1-like isoform X3 [Mercenaria mercenaria]